MKKIFIIIAIALIFASCEDYDALPETELPVENIEFKEARYNLISSTDPENIIDTHSISLYFLEPPQYLDIYKYYNKSSSLLMDTYIKNTNITVTETKIYDNYIEFYFKYTGALPLELVFNTKEPLYFGTRVHASWWQGTLIVAKGFIITDKIAVTYLP